MVAATAGAGIATIVSTVRVAFAASTGASLPPEYGELLGLAQQKVQAATQPGAFGNGVPVLYGADPATMLPWIGVAISAALAAVCAVKLLTPRIRNGVPLLIR
ncbi:MAG: hypothetical protein ABI347_11190 [Nitrososphaera sp.]